MSLNASICPIVTLVPSSYDDSFSGYLLHAAAFTPSEFCFSIIALYTYLLANNLVGEEKMSLYILKLYQFLIEIANTSLQLFQMLTSCDRKCKWEVWGVLVACLGSHKLFHAFLVMMAYTLKLNAKINCSSLKKKGIQWKRHREIISTSLPSSPHVHLGGYAQSSTTAPHECSGRNQVISERTGNCNCEAAWLDRPTVLFCFCSHGKLKALITVILRSTIFTLWLLFTYF